MGEKPILFSGPMVRAILEGRKTQTRRLVRKPIPDGADEVFNWTPGALAATIMPNVARSGLWARRNDGEDGEDGWLRFLGACPYGQGGDRLWVRETWAEVGPGFIYAATDADHNITQRWRPSLHMRRLASRLTLEVVSVRVERLQEISEEDARAEGAVPDQLCPAGFLDTRNLDPSHTHRGAFACLWDSINSQRASWASNPWVWVVEFKRVEVL